MTRLEQLRIDGHLTVDALAERTGVAPKTIRRLEHGQGARVETLARLSTFFAVPASSLLLPVLPATANGDRPEAAA
jgi:transcriptional regulator with XRE-family HTH domain